MNSEVTTLKNEILQELTNAIKASEELASLVDSNDLETLRKNLLKLRTTVRLISENE